MSTSTSTSPSQVIAVFGAGQGLGASVARRFGQEGFSVALIARRKDRLDALVEQLKAEGIDTAGFAADLTRPEKVPAVITAIRDHFGRIDVVEYGPISGEQTFVPAAQLDSATLLKDAPLLLLTPVEVARAVLPDWTARGNGAFLMTTGATAGAPMPFLSGVGPLMAAARNWLFSLSGEVGHAGIYVGTLSIAAFIAGSEMGELAAANVAANDLAQPGAMVDAEDLADIYWDMYTNRDCVERVHPQPAAGKNASWLPLSPLFSRFFSRGCTHASLDTSKESSHELGPRCLLVGVGSPGPRCCGAADGSASGR